MRVHRHLLALAVFALAASPPAALLAQVHPPAPAPGAAPLFDDLGEHHRTISTVVPEAQRFFDQGLRLMFAFNLEEAERSFREAARLDPTCAVCYWGVGLALGPHINFPATPERTVAAARAVAQGVAAISPATPAVERELLAGLARRYADPPPATPEAQAALDAAYAEAMRALAKRYPEDPDVVYLAAEALMNQHPWDLYEADGREKPWTGEIVAMLERGLAASPAHSGLNHVYIHAVEASPRPDRAVASADRLRAAMPGAGHLVHMPSHIYQRVGRYADSALANERAIAADGGYLPNAGGFMMYSMYAAHNHQFLWLAALMQGRSAVAFAAARDAAGGLPLDMLRAAPGYDGWLAYPVWTLVRFGRYPMVLAEPLPPAEFPYLSAVTQVARGIAYARLGELAEAERARAEAERFFALLPPEAYQGWNSVTVLAGIANRLLQAEIARARGAWEEGARALAEAAALEDSLRYNEPADWYYPVREVLGPYLLEAGEAGKAEAVLREDLIRNPENGWALTGLAAALRRQGRDLEAAAVEKRRDVAWAGADLGLDRLAAPPAAPAAAGGRR